MEFGEDSLGSSKPGERPHRGPDYVLGSSDKVLMGPASKTPPTHRGSEGQDQASTLQSTPSSAVEVDSSTTGSRFLGSMGSPEDRDRIREYRPPEDLMGSEGGVETMGQASSPQTSLADIASMGGVVGRAHQQYHSLSSQQTRPLS